MALGVWSPYLDHESTDPGERVAAFRNTLGGIGFFQLYLDTTYINVSYDAFGQVGVPYCDGGPL